MKILLFVTLGLLVIGSLILYQGQNSKVQMNDDAKSTKEEIRMFGDIKSMKAEVLKHVPIGTSIHDAKQVMEENGFRCTMYNNAIFTEKGDEPKNDPEGKKDILHYNADFLSCRKEGTPFQYVYREWAVTIVHKNDVVSDIFANTWVTGP